MQCYSGKHISMVTEECLTFHCLAFNFESDYILPEFYVTIITILILAL